MPKYIIEPTILALKEKTILISNFNYGEKKKKNLLQKIQTTMKIEKLKKKNRLP